MTGLFFLVRSLEPGGAERQLIELTRGLDKSNFQITVATFYDGGAWRPVMESIPGVQAISLGKQDRWDMGSFLLRLIRTVRALRPAIVHGYLDVANIFALLAGRLAGAKVVFGTRAAFVDFSQYDWTARATYQLAIFLARFADGVIVNSESGLEYHRANGLAQENATIIPNGIDIQTYRRERALGLSLRADWGISPEEKLVGLVGRLDPMKDHQTFLQAAARLEQNVERVRFVCIGDGPAGYRQSLQDFAENVGAGRVIWAGAQKDMPAAYNALDLLALSSRGEGFPNVVAEAMACEIPCVVTDVGDCARIVGNCGVVAPPEDSGALADGLQSLLLLTDAERESLGLRTRQRILDEFSTEKMVAATESFLTRLLEQ
jgi:glycosyltransferase involved in cell wall biosynthesis